MRNRERLYIRELCKESRHICIQGRSWGGSACGRDRKRRVVHKETKCACFAVGVVCEVSVREPHN